MYQATTVPADPDSETVVEVTCLHLFCLLFSVVPLLLECKYAKQSLDIDCRSDSSASSYSVRLLGTVQTEKTERSVCSAVQIR